eukprot:5294517-Amphidinium_carterae.1
MQLRYIPSPFVLSPSAVLKGGQQLKRAIRSRVWADFCVWTTHSVIGKQNAISHMSYKML